MPLEPWESVHDEHLLSFKVFDVHRVVRRSPRTGGDGEFFVLRTIDWANVIAFLETGELILVRQYRHGTARFSLEIPGGVVDPGEDPAVTALRELREETGYVADGVRHIGTVSPNPALQTNVCHTFLAHGCRRAGELLQDAGEDIEVVTLPLPAVEAAVARGEIEHALTLAGLYFHRLAGPGPE